VESRLQSSKTIIDSEAPRTSPPKKQADADAADSGESKPTWRGAAREAVAAYLRELFAPVTKWLIRHQVKARRFGGLGSLAAGVGFMAGGLGPLGLSLIFVGVAVLLVELEISRRPPSDGRGE